MHRHERATALFFYRQIAAKLKRHAAWRAKRGLAERRGRHPRERAKRMLSKAGRSCFAQHRTPAQEEDEEEEFAGRQAGGKRARPPTLTRVWVFSLIDVNARIIVRRVIQPAAWRCSLLRCFMPISL
jgi:sRNA-binding protein